MAEEQPIRVTKARWVRPDTRDEPYNLIRARIDGEEKLVPVDADDTDFKLVMEHVRRHVLEIEEPKRPSEPFDPDRRDLTPRQFEWLLAVSGLDTVWDAVEGRLKATGNTDLYAFIKAQRKAGAFTIRDTLAFKNRQQVMQVAAVVAPDTDLSDGRIVELWKQAAQQDFRHAP